MFRPLVYSSTTAVMHLYPVESLRLKHGHRTTSATSGPTEAPSPPKPPGFSQPPNHVDRDSAIALGILLVLILSVLGWFCSILIKKRKERDAEQRLSRPVTATTGRARSSTGGVPRFSMDKLLFAGLPSRSRADSGTSTLVGSGSVTGWNGSSEDDERGDHSWPNTSPQSHGRSTTEHHDAATGVPQPPGNHQRSIDRARSLSPLSQATPPQERSFGPPMPRRASHHRHQSSVRSIDTYVPARRASLSLTQYDRQWWSEVASHDGCIARANRRLSTLTPILEPEAALQAGFLDDIHVCECGRPASVHAIGRRSSVRRVGR